MRIEALAATVRRRDRLAPVPARPDLQGAGLDDIAVQSLPGQGPPHGARHGAHRGGARVGVRACRNEFPPTACSPAASRSSASRTAGHQRSPKPSTKRSSRPARTSAIPRCRPGFSPRSALSRPQRCAEANAQPTKDACAVAPAKPRTRASSALRASSPPDGELFWGDDRLEQAMAWATSRAHTRGA